jgi:hypothetical protein
MTPPVEQRYHPRVSVDWPMVFFTPQVFGHGTVVDVSALAWRIRGSVPLVAGMHLAVRVWPQVPVGPPRSGYFEIEEGTVLWARDKEFALEIYQVRAQDVPGMVRLQQQTLPRRFQMGDSGHETLILPALRRPGSLVYEARDADTAGVSERRTSGRMLAHCHVHYRRTDGRLRSPRRRTVTGYVLDGVPHPHQGGAPARRAYYAGRVFHRRTAPHYLAWHYRLLETTPSLRCAIPRYDH